MNYNIAVLSGDGIGPEICDGAIKVLKKVGEKFGHTFNFKEFPIGGVAIDHDTNGTISPATSAPKKGCSAYARRWGFTPTSAPPNCGQALHTPHP